jgi:hypothetical protein
MSFAAWGLRAAGYFQFYMATLTARRSDGLLFRGIGTGHAPIRGEPLLLAVVVSEKPPGKCRSKANSFGLYDMIANASGWMILGYAPCPRTCRLFDLAEKDS